MTGTTQQSRRRPIWVWVISIFYLLSAGYTLLSFGLLLSGQLKIDAAQEAYFASLSSVDWFFVISISLLSIAGAISLFMLRRKAALLFSISLALSIGFTGLQIMRTNWIEALGGPGLFGVLIAWMTVAIVILYTRHLIRKGMLY